MLLMRLWLVVLEYLYRISADKDITLVPLELLDLKLKVRYQPRDMIEKVTSCNSEYIIGTMRCVGMILYSKFH